MERPLIFNLNASLLPFSHRFIAFYHALLDAPPGWADIAVYDFFKRIGIRL